LESNSTKTRRHFDFADCARFARLSFAAAHRTKQMTPIATPVVFGGISQESLAMFAPQLMANGLLPVSGAGGSAAITPLEESHGKNINARNIDQRAVGPWRLFDRRFRTVTFRDGDRIYAFGHPFLSLGASDMPMSETAVVTVIPNVNNSFKLSVPGAMMGSISQDRASGVFGLLGQAPKMIPVKINLHTSRDRSENLFLRNRQRLVF